jgi:chemotaxis protein methyltransferase CheR
MMISSEKAPVDGLSFFAFTNEDFKRISKILHEEAGIYLSDAKIPLVYSRLTKRLRALGLENFRDYCTLVASDRGVDERQQMIAALTTNVTRFFREPHHFQHFKTHVVEKKAAAIKAGGRLRVWSAACSNGQEPYSIAMTILSVIPDAASLDVRVLATDIDPNMIAAGSAGEYSDEVMRAVPADMKEKWFTPVPRSDLWRANDRLSSLVAFRELNLVGQWPMKSRFDAIFCRNVVIYFEEKTQQEIWRRFVPCLNQNGLLYIGHSERVSGPAADKFASEGVTTYRLVNGAKS